MPRRLPLAPLPILPFAAAPPSPRKPASASPRKPISMSNSSLNALAGPSSTATIFDRPVRAQDALATLFDGAPDLEEELTATPPRRLLDAFLQSAAKPKLERSPSNPRQSAQASPRNSRSASPIAFIPRQPEDSLPFEIYEDEQDSSIILPTFDEQNDEDYPEDPKENVKPVSRPLSVVTSFPPTSRPTTPPPFENRIAPTSAALLNVTTPPSSATSTPSSRFAESMSTFEGTLSRSAMGTGSTLLPGFAIVESPPGRVKRSSLGETGLETREEKRMRRDSSAE